MLDQTTLSICKFIILMIGFNYTKTPYLFLPSRFHFKDAKEPLHSLDAKAWQPGELMWNFFIKQIVFEALNFILSLLLPKPI